MALAAAWRAPRLSGGVDGDEVANLVPGDWAAQLASSETAVNPPTLRWIAQLLRDRPDPVHDLRLLAWTCGALAAGVAVWTAARRARTWWPVVLVAALHVLHADVAVATTTARAYGPAMLGVALHLLAVDRWLDVATRRRTAAVVLTALALPWQHYTTVPWLVLLAVGAAALAPGRRWLAVAYVPAALGALPLLSSVLTGTRRFAPGHTAATSVAADLLGLGLHGEAVPALWGGHAGPAWLAAAVGALACGVVLVRGPAHRRVLAVATLAIPVTAVLLTGTHEVRAPVVALVVAAGASTWAGLADGAGRRGTLARLAIVPLVALLLAGRHTQVPAHDGASDALRDLAHAVRDGSLPPGDLVVVPRHQLLPLVYGAAGRHVSALSDRPGCVDVPDCRTVAGRRLLGRDVVDGTTARHVVWVGREAPATPAGCVVAETRPGLTRWACSPW